MVPPELRHTSGSGLIMYMFKALARMVSDTCRNILDALHQRISVDAQRQSETDFPWGSVRNGIIDEKNVNPLSAEVTYSVYCA